jgi:RNA 3'-terminal phosphate cyclase (ATP)
MIEIDGSEGEGGGQILRSALSLAMCTQQPFRIANIRANREKPGLLRQHLTALMAAAEICGAQVQGAAMGSREVTFRPGNVRGGDYLFDIGTAGSCTLVLQTVLPPLLTADAASRIRVIGGTHNPFSPPFDFLQRAFAPLLGRMGVNVELDLLRFGFYPRGGGEIRAHVVPVGKLERLELTHRGSLVRGFAEAYVAAIPLHVAQRELAVIGRALMWTQEQLLLRALPNDIGPGNAVTITLQYENVTEVFTGFGEKDVHAESVAELVANEARTYLRADAPVGAHLADQLILPMALAAAGSFRAVSVSQHLRSNALVIERFTGRRLTIEPRQTGFEISVS